jgi:hypothetical protein
MLPIWPETTHLIGWVVDIHPLVGKVDTLVGEGGFGDVKDLGMVIGVDGGCW